MSDNDEKRFATIRESVKAGIVSVEDMQWILIVTDFYRRWAEYAIDTIEQKGHENPAGFYDMFYRNLPAPQGKTN